MGRLYQSDPIKIGKHLWRIAVDYFPYLNSNCTVYEFLRISPYPCDMEPYHWKNYKEWPKYNSNDTYSGLPLSLSKLYHANKQNFSHLLKEVA